MVLTLLFCSVQGCRGLSRVPLPAARDPTPTPGPAGRWRCWRDGQPGAVRPVNFWWTAVLLRPYLLLVGVTDFATLGSGVILPRLLCSKFNCCAPFLP